MIVGHIMDQIGAQLDTIPKLKVKDYDADSIELPAGLVGLPSNINYLGTYGAGMRELVFVVTVLVSMVDDRVRRDAIAPYGDDTGPYSVKAVLEAGRYTAFSSLVVHTGMFTIVSIAKVEYLAVVFNVEVAA